MKNIILKLLLILVIAIPFSALSSQLKFSDIENDVIDVLKKKCNKILDYRSYPTSFKNRSQLIYCETLKDIGKNYSKENRYLISSSLESYGNYHQTNQIFKEFYGEISQKKEKTLTERGNTKNVHPLDLILSIDNEKKLEISEEQKKVINEKYGNTFKLFFKKSSQIKEKQLDMMIEWAFVNQLNLSPMLNEVIINKIGRVLIERYGYNEKLYEWVLNKPYKTRRKLLTLWSSIKLKDFTFINFLRAISWSGNQIWQSKSYNLDANENLINFNDGSDNSFFALLNQINNVENGHLTTLSPINTLIQYLKYRKLKNRLLYFEKDFTFSHELIQALVTNLNNTDEINIKLLREINNPIINNLISAEEVYQLIYNNDERINNKEKKKIFSKFSKSKFQDFIFLIREAHIKNFSEEYVRGIIQGYEKSIKEQCDALESDKCFIEWMQLATDNIEVINVDKSCSDTWFSKELSDKFIKNKIISLKYILYCSNISNSYQIKKSDFVNFIAYPHPFGGIRWGHSSELYTGNFGTFGNRLLNTFSGLSAFPLPLNVNYISELYSPEGFSLMNNLISKNSKNNKDFINHYTLSRFSELLGRYNDSFKNSMLSVEKYFGKNLSPAHANLIFLGKNVGIPKNYLSDFVTNSSKLYSITELEKSNDNRLSFLNGYVSNIVVSDVFKFLKSSNTSLNFYGLGALLSFTSTEKYEFCSRANSMKILNDYWIQKNSKNVDSIRNTGRFVSYEFYNLNTICRAQILKESIKITSSSDFNFLSNKIYHKFLTDILIPMLKNDSNFAESAFLDSIISFIQISALANKPLGVSFGLNTLTAIFEKLQYSFIVYDSDVLRNEQSRIENALTLLGISLSNNDIFQHSHLRHLKEKHEQLLLGIHNPLISDKIRRRHIINANYINDNTNIDYENFKKSLISKRKSSAKSQTIIDYLINSADKIDDVHNLYFNNYTNSNLMITSKLSNSNYLNIVSDGSLIFALGKDIDSKVLKYSSFAEVDLTGFLKEIEQNSSLSTDSINSLCKIFTDFHIKISSFVNASENLTITPSVNLFPIPFEIIIGNGCKNSIVRKDLSIILVNDYMTALELDQTSTNFRSPSNLIGIGNPVLSLDEFEFDLGDWRSGAYLKTNSFDLSKLPPLPDAEIEIKNSSYLFESTDVFVGPHASISKGLYEAQSNAMSNEKNLIIVATHGFSADVGNQSKLPGLLSIENGDLSLFLANQIEEYQLDNSIVILSACDTASGFVKETDKMFTGFVKSLSNADAEFIIASLWPVNSVAARYVSEDFTKSIIKNNYFSSISNSMIRVEYKPNRLPFVFIYP